MKLTHSFPQNYQALRDLTIASVGDAQSVVFQAGHFLLVYDEATRTILPCIHGHPSTETRPMLFESYGHFPLLTWKLALRLLSDLKVPSKNIMIVVNDWQYLPEGTERFDFYRRQAGRLPAEFAEELQAGAPSVSLLEPEIKGSVSTAPFYGEMNLRNRYTRRVRDLVSSRRLPASAIIHESESGVSCKLPDLSGAHQEIYCSGKTGDCTAEIAEMLREANARTGATCFVNLYPLVCRSFVELGTSRAEELFQVPLRSVLNLGFPSSGVTDEGDLIQECEASLHLFD